MPDRFWYTTLNLKLTFGQYPAIHTNYTVYQTAPIYNINLIIFDTVLRQKGNIEHEKNNEFNSAAIFSLWHESSRLRRCHTNVPGI